MTIFQTKNYKTYVLQKLTALPKRGRGEFQKIATHLRVHSTLISQVFRGSKNLTSEQSIELCEYLGLNDLEIEFFLVLVQLERAGSEKLRKQLEKQLSKIKSQSEKLSSRLSKDTELTPHAKAVFYSNWLYSGVRLLTSVKGYDDVNKIAEYFSVPKSKVRNIVDFLITSGLCMERDGMIQMGPQRTHLEADSPLVQRHHTNWRIKAIQNYERMSDSELSFTGPMSLSEKDFTNVRELMIDTIKVVTKIVTESEPEIIACFNFDWFRL